MLYQLSYRGTLARMTGLEPATSGVTGLRSNQLSYTPIIWWKQLDLNQ